MPKLKTSLPDFLVDSDDAIADLVTFTDLNDVDGYEGFLEILRVEFKYWYDRGNNDRTTRGASVPK